MTAVTLLTQQACGLCDQAQDTLARLSAEYDLDVCAVSLNSQDGRELGMRHGVLFAPGILLEDALFSYGRLSERKLRRELDSRSRPGARS